MNGARRGGRSSEQYRISRTAIQTFGFRALRAQKLPFRIALDQPKAVVARPARGNFTPEKFF